MIEMLIKSTDCGLFLLVSLYFYRYKYMHPSLPADRFLIEYQHNYTALVAGNQLYLCSST